MLRLKAARGHYRAQQRAWQAERVNLMRESYASVFNMYESPTAGVGGASVVAQVLESTGWARQNFCSCAATGCILILFAIP